jgi:DNA-binding beta-propeller fold protein YncE
MQTSVRSIREPLLGALCTVVIGIASLWAMPRSAHAQIYVSQGDTAGIGEYDATTGAAINANFITGEGGLGGSLLLSGNDLFASTGNPSFILTIAEFNATTGAAINASFITGVHGGELALSGNNLFVVNGNTVGEYDATTGAVINANFITGLPQGGNALALSGNNLFVANEVAGTVGEYDATTGAVINANFITGLIDPVDLVAAPVPEPSTWSMITVGGVALLGMMLRKKRGIV